MHKFLKSPLRFFFFSLLAFSVNFMKILIQSQKEKKSAMQATNTTFTASDSELIKAIRFLKKIYK